MTQVADAVLCDDLAALALHGSIRKAAEARDMAPGTFQGRLAQAKARGLMGAFTAPEIPSDDEPEAETWARLEAEQDRKEAHAAAVDWMRFDVDGSEPFALAFVGDPHLDQCDARRLRRHLDVIEHTPRMWGVGLGDWLNSWVGKLRGQYAMQTVTERQAITLAKAVLQRPVWMLLLLGNHDGQRWHGSGNPVRWLETSSPVPMQDWQAKFTVACAGRSWRVWAAHNFPGNSMWNVLHGPAKRAQQTAATADLYIAGDRHTFGCAQLQEEHSGRPYWIARSRGYKPLDNYALEQGHGPAGGARGIGHSVTAVCDPRTGTMVCLADIEEAASYLTFLRMRRLS